MLEKMAAIIAANGENINAADITEDTDFVADLGFTSLDIVNCISDAEEEFGKEIPEEELENIRTVGDVIELLK